MFLSHPKCDVFWSALFILNVSFPTCWLCYALFMLSLSFPSSLSVTVRFLSYSDDCLFKKKLHFFLTNTNNYVEYICLDILRCKNAIWPLYDCLLFNAFNHNLYFLLGIFLPPKFIAGECFRRCVLLYPDWKKMLTTVLYLKWHRSVIAGINFRAANGCQLVALNLKVHNACIFIPIVPH